MKLFNTDIIDTVADDKKCLIQGWCFKKSLSAVLKRKIYVFQRCVSLRHIKFSKICLLFWSEFMSEYFPKWVTQLFRLSNTDSANRFSFLKNFSF